MLQESGKGRIVSFIISRIRKLTVNMHLSYRFVLGSSLNRAVSLLPVLAFLADFATKLNLISFVSTVAAIAALLVLALDLISTPTSVTASWKSLWALCAEPWYPFQVLFL